MGRGAITTFVILQGKIYPFGKNTVHSIFNETRLLVTFVETVLNAEIGKMARSIVYKCVNHFLTITNIRKRSYRCVRRVGVACDLIAF